MLELRVKGNGDVKPKQYWLLKAMREHDNNWSPAARNDRRLARQTLWTIIGIGALIAWGLAVFKFINTLQAGVTGNELLLPMLLVFCGPVLPAICVVIIRRLNK